MTIVAAPLAGCVAADVVAVADSSHPLYAPYSCAQLSAEAARLAARRAQAGRTPGVAFSVDEVAATAALVNPWPMLFIAPRTSRITPAEIDHLDVEARAVDETARRKHCRMPRAA